MLSPPYIHTHSYMRKQFAVVAVGWGEGGAMGLNAINNNAAARAHKIHVQKPKSTLCANGRPEYVHTHTHTYTQYVHDTYIHT